MKKYILIILLVILYLIYFKKSIELFEDNIYLKHPQYLNRKLINSEKPKFKLNAICLNLENKKKNYDFIQHEWKDYLNVERFKALSTATKSHSAILSKIYQNRKKYKFPIVVMEDDVFRKNNFNKFWNQLFDFKNIDYITLDCFKLKISKKQPYKNKGFIKIEKHNSCGFIIYYSHFFNRFSNVEEMLGYINRPIDLSLTHNYKFIKLTPQKQICQQIVDKISTTRKGKKNTKIYQDYYIQSEKLLSNIKL